MFSLDVNNTFFVEQKQVLEQALSTNPKTQTALRKLIQKVIKEAREEMIPAAQNAMKSDPRGAAYGIRRSVYKKILGAQINIYNHKKAGRPTAYEPPRKLQPQQRGGNRVPRGLRTNTMIHYGPHDRQMILMWLNAGTDNRDAGTRGGKLHGNRGSIAARNFFGTRGSSVMQRAIDNLATMIDTELMSMLNKKKN